MSSSRAARQRAAETKRQRSRSAILEAATRLFEEHGWLPTTVDAIATEAGVGVATVYNHFPNKNVIAGLVFLPVVEDLISDPRWSDEAVPPPEALSVFVEELVYRVRKRARLTIALLEAVNDSTARHGTNITEDDPRYWVPLPPVFSMIIERGQASGDFLDYPPARDAGPFFSNMLLLRVLTRPEESATATTRLILTVLMRTFAITDAGSGINSLRATCRIDDLRITRRTRDVHGRPGGNGRAIVRPTVPEVSRLIQGHC